MTYLISKVETNTPATLVAVTTAAQTLVTFSTNESSEELLELEAIVEMRTTASSTATQDVTLRITIGGATKDFVYRPGAVVARQKMFIKASGISKLKDTITIALQGSAAADAATTFTVNYAYLYGINT